MCVCVCAHVCVCTWKGGLHYVALWSFRVSVVHFMLCTAGGVCCVRHHRVSGTFDQKWRVCCVARRFGWKCALLWNACTELLNILEPGTFGTGSWCTTSRAIVCLYYKRAGSKYFTSVLWSWRRHKRKTSRGTTYAGERCMCVCLFARSGVESDFWSGLSSMECQAVVVWSRWKVDVEVWVRVCIIWTALSRAPLMVLEIQDLNRSVLDCQRGGLFGWVVLAKCVS